MKDDDYKEIIKRMKERSTQGNTQHNRRRQTIENPLDYNMAMIDNVWGKDSINESLQEKLSKINPESVEKDSEGNIYVTKEYLWGLLGFFTRDFRLSNLGRKDFDFCAYYTDLANDLLQCDMVEPFLICIGRVARTLELCQSKGGFLRKQSNTLTTENVEKSLEPTKKNWFGSSGNSGKGNVGGY